MCANACPSGKYVYEVSANLKLCVDSCKDLNPTAYITKASDTCTRSCATGEVIDKTDSNKPKCANSCPST